MSDGGAQFKQFGPFFDNNGVLYRGIKINVYAAGTTNNKTYWTDEGKTSAGAHPLVDSDNDGLVSAYFDGDYRFQIKDSSGVDLDVALDDDLVKVTSDMATMWEGNFGTSYPSAAAKNRWQLFAKVDASNNFLELGINEGAGFITISGKPITFDPRAFGAKFDGATDDYTALQACIDATLAVKGRMIMPPGTAICNTGLVIDGAGSLFMILEGSGWGTIIDFSGVSSGDALTLGTTVAPNGTVFKNFKILGTTSINGLRINSVGSGINVARCRFEHLNINTFDTGMQTTYFTTTTFDNVQLVNCNLGWDGNTQTNNIDTQGMRFVNCKQFFNFHTCEGIGMSSPQFQNITDATEDYSFIMRQSNVTMKNPYFESLDNADICLLGGSGDTVGCVLHIDGGIMPGGKDIAYKINVNHSIRVKGIYVKGGGSIAIKTDEALGAYLLRDAELSNINDDVTTLQGEIVGDHWWDNSEVGWYGNSTTRIVHKNKYVTLDRAGNLTGTWTLTPGDPYTLIICGRREAATTVTMRELTSATPDYSFELTIPDTTEEFQLQYVPFMATGDELNLIHTGYFQMKVVRLVKGHVFPKLDIHKELTLFQAAAPQAGSGSWVVGQTVLKTVPVSGATPGWRCTVAGDPGTWVALANMA